MKKNVKYIDVTLKQSGSGDLKGYKGEETVLSEFEGSCIDIESDHKKLSGVSLYFIYNSTLYDDESDYTDVIEEDLFEGGDQEIDDMQDCCASGYRFVNVKVAEWETDE